MTDIDPPDPSPTGAAAPPPPPPPSATASSASPSPRDDVDAGPLAHVVDDDLGADDATEWAGKELVRGRTFETVAADLAGGGWDAEAVDRIVEDARRQTRAERGVVTRDEVAYRAERRYRTALRNLRWVGFGLLPAALLIARNVLVSARAVLAASPRAGRPQPPADGPDRTPPG